MFNVNKRKNSSEGAIDTLIGSNAVIDGNIEAKGNIRIEGRIKGNVEVSGDITIGRHALIIGNVYAGNIELNGTVEGNIHSRGMLRMTTTSKLYGDIEVESFVSDQGAVFEGKCTMLNPPAESDLPDGSTDVQLNDSMEQKEEEPPRVSLKKTKDFKKSSLISQLDEGRADK